MGVTGNCDAGNDLLALIRKKVKLVITKKYFQLVIHIARDHFPGKYVLQKIFIDRKLSTESYEGGVGVLRIEVCLNIPQRNITD